MRFIVYGKNNCQFCDKAKEVLTNKNFEFTYMNLGEDYTKEELLELAPDAKTVPQIWVIYEDSYYRPIGGYDSLVEYISEMDDQYKSLFFHDMTNYSPLSVEYNTGLHSEQDMLTFISLDPLDKDIVVVSGKHGKFNLNYSNVISYTISESI